jgi:hypothetical protein
VVPISFLVDRCVRNRTKDPVGLEPLQHVGGETQYESRLFSLLSSEIGAALSIYLHTAANHGMIRYLKVA